VIDRQKLVGWVLIVVSAGFLIYFLRTRLFAFGPPLEKGEWIRFFLFLGLLMIGTMNVRLAAMRDRRRNEMRQKRGSDLA
jgi:hypothetical protein